VPAVGRSVGPVGYDALAESVALLGGAPLATRVRLSRRVRSVALAADRDGDVAVTLFLRRGVNGVPLLDVHTLELTDGSWRTLGGGGGPGYEALEPRPRLADLGSPAVVSGSGGTARSSAGPDGGDGWVWWAQLRAVDEVSALRAGDRVVPVAGHGLTVVVWTAEPPAVTALDAAGAVLGTVRLHRPGHRRPGG
jgi:hypothetical protein